MRKFTTLVALTSACALATGLWASSGAGAASANGNGRTQIAKSQPVWANAANKAGNVSNNDIVVRVYLHGRDDAGLTATAKAVSNPKSALFHHYLTPAQVRARFSPAQSTVDAVRAWLSGNGLRINAAPANNIYVEAVGSPGAVQQAFDVQLANYNVDGQQLRAADRNLSVPSALASSIAGVIGVDDAQSLLQPKHLVDGSPRDPGAPGFRNSQPCGAFFGEKLDTTDPAYGGGFPNPLPYAPCGYKPGQLRAAYGIADTVDGGTTGKSATVAIVDAFASPTIFQDASTYASINDPSHPLSPGQFSQAIMPTNHKEQGLNGKKCDQLGWYGEETLDVEAVHAMAPGAHILYVGGADCLDPTLDVALNAVVANGWAQIVSNSYGDIGEEVPADEVAAFQEIAQQAVTQGIGLYFSSGDDGDETDNLPKPEADFSASSPWVTAVGGTSLGVDANNRVSLQTGWETGKSTLAGGVYTPAAPGAFLYGSGGGTSMLFAQPDYQAPVVPSDMSTANNPNGAPMRVVPDISMDGDPNTGMLVGQTQKFPDGVYYDQYRIGGTSLSSPLFAGVMALADDLQGGPPHGFINPALYALPTNTPGAITDVQHVNGADVRVDFVNSVDSKKGLTTSVRTFDFGGLSIHTRVGYDNTTGLGVPNGAAFLQHI
jgi:subtilase family serine protease